MIIRKNNSKIIQLSLVLFVGISLLFSCKRSEENSNKLSAGRQSKLTVIIPVSQLEAKLETEKDQSILVKNDGNEPIKDIVLGGFEAPLTVAEGANGCTDKILQPSESCEVKLTFKPTKVESGKKNIVISYNNDVGTEPKNEDFEVRFLGIGNVNLDIPTFLAQFKAKLGQSDKKVLIITNKGMETAKDLQISSLIAPFSNTTTCKKELASNEKCEVEITFSPKEIKSGSQKLKINYNEFASIFTGRVTKEIQVSFAAIGKANLTIDAGQGKFITNANKEKTRIIKVTNEGNATATEIKTSVVMSPLSIIRDTCSKISSLDANKTCEIELKFNPKSQILEGSQSIAIEYKDGIYGVGKTITSGILNYHSVAKDILNLSDYIVNNASIELDTSCTKKEIYGNNLHNIPLIPSFIAVDDQGKTISVSAENIFAATQIQVRYGGRDNPVPFNSNEVIFDKTEYTKCVESSLAGDAIPEKGLFYKTGAAGQTVVLGAQLQYIDKNEKISSVSTTESGRRSITVLSDPRLSGILAPTLFSITRTAEAYDGGLVTRDNYRVFKISPDTKLYPSLSEVKVSEIRITNKDVNQSSELLPVTFTQSQPDTLGNKYLMPIAYFPQSRGGIGEYKRSFYSGYFISGKNKPSSVPVIWMSKNTTKNLTLNDISSNDFAIATISDSGMPGFVWNYQWDVPFLLELNGTDSYGNTFQGQVSSNF